MFLLICRVLASVVVASVSFAIARVADWPMLGRDATRNAVSPEKNPPTRWQTGEVEENVKWKAALGSISYSDPVVSGGLVWIGTNNTVPGKYDQAADASVLLCLRESDGRPLYRYVSPRLPQGRVHDSPLSSMACSPLIENDRLWFTTNRGEVVCLDIGPLLRSKDKDERITRDDAKVLWKLDLMRELNVFIRGASMAICHTCSIAGWKDYVYVITGNGAPYHQDVPRPEAPSLVCLDKRTGKVVWQDSSPGTNILEGQWSSPLVIEAGGQAQVIAPQGDGWLRSFDAATGKPLWWFDINLKESRWKLAGSDRRMMLATPVYYEGRVYIGSGLPPEYGESGGRLCCIDPTKRGDISTELALDAANNLLAHRRLQAVDTARGERAVPNPNSGLVWEFAPIGKTFEQRMHGTLSNVAIDQGLVIAATHTGLVHCLDAKTGKQYWSHDVLAGIVTSPLIADGIVYISDEDGDVTVLALGKEKKVLAEDVNQVGDSVYISPIFANGVLYVGSRSTLYAIAQGEAATPAEKKTPAQTAGHWPQWRGPNRDNISHETGLLTEWPKDGPPLLWKVTGLGDGIAPVSVAGGRVFTVGRQDQDEYVVTFDEQTGDLVWTTKIAADLPLENRLMRWLGQRPPTVDEDRLYMVTTVGDLICLQVTDGKELWRKSYAKEFNGKPGSYGFCDRPLVDGDKLICMPGGSEASVVALDKRTSEVLWKAMLPDNDRGTYGSFVISDGGGVRHYVGHLGKALVGIAADDGRILWQYAKNTSRFANDSSTPIPRGDNIVVANGYGRGLALLKLTRNENNVAAEEQYFKSIQFDPFVDTATVAGGYLYATTGTGLPTCIEVESGKEMWRVRPTAARGRIAFAYADGHLWLRSSDGVVTLVPATPKEYVEKAHFKIPDHVDSSGATFPVITAGRL
jgi:outer membrane protein assembly factor BamB